MKLKISEYEAVEQAVADGIKCGVYRFEKHADFDDTIHNLITSEQFQIKIFDAVMLNIAESFEFDDDDRFN